MTINQSSSRALDALTIHPLLAPVPRLALDAPEMLALIASVETHGVLAPLIVNERAEIIDGRARLIAAQKAGLTEVPCVVVPDEDAATLILDTLCARRHLTKSALAYVFSPGIWWSGLRVKRCGSLVQSLQMYS